MTGLSFFKVHHYKYLAYEWVRCNVFYRGCIYAYAIISSLTLFSPTVMAELVVSYRAPETSSDNREAYNIELIALALEKTKAKYGDYKMQAMPQMNHPRSMYAISVDMFPNILLEVSYNDKYLKYDQLTYIAFPVDLGSIGHRICFSRKALTPELRKIQRIEDLKRYNFGLGAGWEDVEIMRRNGFHVTVVNNYDSLFRLTAAGRVDLFCRGAIEVKSEYGKFRNILDYDNGFSISYRLPRFFFTNAKNVVLKKRMEEGLQLAYEDGTLACLWSKHYADSIKFVALNTRKDFGIENPFISLLPKKYDQLVYFENFTNCLKGAP